MLQKTFFDFLKQEDYLNRKNLENILMETNTNKTIFIIGQFDDNNPGAVSFSKKPTKHRNFISAKTEATRLAQSYGVSFGVFQLVDKVVPEKEKALDF